MFRLNKSDNYILWNGINTCIQSINTTLASGMILSKLNVIGNTTLTLYNYIGRDAFGQLGGAGYSYYKGPQIKKDPKSSGNVANSLIIGSTLAEWTISYLPLSGKMILFPLAVANVGKNIGWIGSGAVNTHYMSSLSGENISEMYTRMAITNSIGSTVGTIIGLSLIKFTIRNKIVGIGTCLCLCLANKLTYEHLLNVASVPISEDKMKN
jgi:hypothetical protein